jgi:hypothetical protein
LYEVPATIEVRREPIHLPLVMVFSGGQVKPFGAIVGW